MNGLGVTAPRPGCPATTFSPTRPPTDPCEIQYKFDFPVIGEETIGIPLNQIINDAKIQIRNGLPEMIDAAWVEALPKINDMMLTVEQVFIPDGIERAFDEHLWPEMDLRQEIVIAHANVLKNEAISAAVAITATMAMAVGLAAWWVKK